MPAFSITDIVAAYHGSTRIAVCYHGANRIPFGLTEPQDFAADLFPGDAPSRPSDFAAHVSEGVTLYDPEWDKVVLRMSDSFAPDSQPPVTINTVGTTQLESTTKKFGSASFSCSSATVSYIEAVFPTAPLGASSNPWTIEFWFYMRSNPTDSNDCLISSATAYTWQPPEWQLRVEISTKRLQILTGGWLLGTGTTSLQLNRWYHLAINHVPNYGGVTDWTDIYLDGQQEIGGGDTVNRNETNLRWNTNRNRSTSMNNLYDDIRVTSGVARYLPATNFNPPTSAHPVLGDKPTEPTGLAIDLDNVINTPSAPQEFSADLTDVSTPTDPYYSDVSLLLQESYNDESSNGLTVVWPSGITVTSAAAYTGTNGFDVTGNGTAVRAVLPVDSVLEFPDDFTIEGWFKVGAQDYYGSFLHWTASSSQGAYSLALRVGAAYGSGVAAFGGNIQGTSKTVSGTTDLRDGNWHHVAVVRSGGTVTLYVDGVSEGTPFIDTTTLSFSGGHLGDVQGWYANNTDNEWGGQFDMLRITKGVARYTSTFSPPTTAFPTAAPAPTVDPYFSDVVLLLQDSLTDESPVGQTITYNGTAGLSTDSKVGTHSISSPAGNANYVSIASSTDFGFGSGDFTLECWFKYPNAINVAADLVMLFDFRPAGTAYVYPVPALYINGAQLLYYVNGGNRINATKPAANTWNHVAVCRISGTTEMFLNGVSQGTWADTTNYTSPSVLRLGRNESGTASGAMLVDSVRVTKGVGRYATNFSPPTTAFPTSAPAPTVDPYFSDVVLLLQDSLADESLQGHTLTVSGNTAATTVASKFGSSFSFDGSGDWITASPDSSLVFGTSPFTVEFWMYWDGTVTGTPWMGVMGAHDGYGVDRYGIFMNANGITHYIQTQFPAVSAVPANQWVHIASTRDSSGVCRFFIDGVLKRTNTDTGNLTATHGFRVGNDFNLNRPPFSGYLDDIRVTKGVARYTANFTPQTTAFPATNGDPDFADVSLLLQDSLADESLQGQTIVANGNTQIDTATKKFGSGSIYLDGSGDYLEATIGTSLSLTGDFTLEGWIKTTSTTSGGPMFQHRRSAYSAQDMIELTYFYANGSGEGRIRVIDYTATSSGANLNDGNWHHIAGVRSGTSLKVYIDGVESASTTLPSTSYAPSPVGLPLTIGRDRFYTARDFLGHYDDLRITKGVARYTSNFTPPTAAFPN